MPRDRSNSGGRRGGRRHRDDSRNQYNRREARGTGRRGNSGGRDSRDSRDRRHTRDTKHGDRHRGNDRRRAQSDSRDNRRRSRTRDDYRGGKKHQKKVTPPPLKRTPSSESASDDSNSDSAGSQDEIIHFDWKKGMLMNSRYELHKLAGDGTFGRVVMARDRETRRDVAIKIIRDVKRYQENAKIEADILKDIRKADPQGTSGCAVMFETFTYEKKFYCLVFEPLGASLYDFLKDNGFRGFWMQDIQSFTEQSMKALAFLHGRLKMTHTDLKPENVLLYSMAPAEVARFPRESEWRRRNPDEKVGYYLRPVSNKIKLIDFGNATYESEHHSSIINTRQYRGPEVLLGLGWNERSDLWSMACILMELYTGEQLFCTHEELEHLALIDRIIGRLPPSMLDRASKEVKAQYLVHDSRSGNWRLPWPERSSSSSSVKHVRSQLPLVDQAPREHRAFTQFTSLCLDLDPARRPSAAELLEHPYLKMKFED